VLKLNFRLCECSLPLF